ncbi:hypothetical protein CGZ69_33390 [Streptomyces peucetius subsp. caesius ATCC 27952]|nr:hypothetical protein CGZ69_33390 [Streptomyces peucetius subsp. caesius ATCC 27952]
MLAPPRRRPPVRPARPARPAWPVRRHRRGGAPTVCSAGCCAAGLRGHEAALLARLRKPRWT